MFQLNGWRFCSKGLNKRTLEDTEYEPMSKYRRVLDDSVNLKSTNCGVDFKFTASSRNRLYLDIGPFPVSSSVVLLSPLLLNLILSLLLS